MDHVPVVSRHELDRHVSPGTTSISTPSNLAVGAFVVNIPGTLTTKQLAMIQRRDSITWDGRVRVCAYKYGTDSNGSNNIFAEHLVAGTRKRWIFAGGESLKHASCYRGNFTNQEGG